MSKTFADLKKLDNKKQVFEQIKSDGYQLLQEGKIDAKTYYARTREIGIELGLINARDYPGRLPKFAEGFLEFVGGTAGAVGGFFAGGPLGAGAGAALGAGTASLGADFLGDLLAPDMPAPSAKQRLQEAGLTAAVDGVITTAIPVAGKALKPTVEKIIKGQKEIASRVAAQAPDSASALNIIERTLGLTDEAAANATKLAEEGVELSLGQASSSPFVRGIYNLSSRMPIAGAPGQKQLKTTFAQVNRSLDKFISPTAKVKPLSELERSKLIQEFGMQSFDDWRKSYTAVYKRAEKLNAAKGNYFSLQPLSNASRVAIPRSNFAEIPADVRKFVDDINNNPNALLDYQDVQILDDRLSALLKKYDPARGEIPNNTAFRAISNLQDTFKRQVRDPNDQAGRLILAGDRLFKEYMAVVEGKLGKEFQKALGRGALRPGIGRAPSQRLEDLYRNTFGDVKSPQAVKDLKVLIGKDRVNVLAANYLDDLFKKHLSADRRSFGKLFTELGFDNKNSKNFAAVEELFKDYKSAFRNPQTGRVETFSVTADELFDFMNILKDFPEALPDVNTFVQRAGILRAAQSVGPATIVGATGVSAGGGVGGLVGLGVLRALNAFLARPFNRNILKNKNATKEQKQNFIRRFLQSLPELPNVPVSVVAPQPAVPAVTGQIEQRLEN